jgi:hypothetical protein
MKRVHKAVVAGTLFLGACGMTESALNAIISQVQSITAGLCQFVPTAISVVDVYNAAIGATAQMVADDICTVVAAIPPITTTQSARLRAASPAMVQVNGQLVPIHGTFTGGPNAGKQI